MKLFIIIACLSVFKISYANEYNTKLSSKSEEIYLDLENSIRSFQNILDNEKSFKQEATLHKFKDKFNDKTKNNASNLNKTKSDEENNTNNLKKFKDLNDFLHKESKEIEIFTTSLYSNTFLPGISRFNNPKKTNYNSKKNNYNYARNLQQIPTSETVKNFNNIESEENNNTLQRIDSDKELKISEIITNKESKKIIKKQRNLSDKANEDTELISSEIASEKKKPHGLKSLTNTEIISSQINDFNKENKIEGLASEENNNNNNTTKILDRNFLNKKNFADSNSVEIINLLYKYNNSKIKENNSVELEPSLQRNVTYSKFLKLFNSLEESSDKSDNYNFSEKVKTHNFKDISNISKKNTNKYKQREQPIYDVEYETVFEKDDSNPQGIQNFFNSNNSKENTITIVKTSNTNNLPKIYYHIVPEVLKLNPYSESYIFKNFKNSVSVVNLQKREVYSRFSTPVLHREKREDLKITNPKEAQGGLAYNINFPSDKQLAQKPTLSSSRSSAPVLHLKKRRDVAFKNSLYATENTELHPIVRTNILKRVSMTKRKKRNNNDALSLEELKENLENKDFVKKSNKFKVSDNEIFLDDYENAKKYKKNWKKLILKLKNFEINLNSTVNNTTKNLEKESLLRNDVVLDTSEEKALLPNSVRFFEQRTNNNNKNGQKKLKIYSNENLEKNHLLSELLHIKKNKKSILSTEEVKMNNKIKTSTELKMLKDIKTNS